MTTLNDIAALKAARAKIENPNNWCTGSRAQDANGYTAFPLDANAAKWCAEGACVFVCGGYYTQFNRLTKMLSKMAFRLTGYDDITEVNDLCGHAKVLETFDQTIRKAEKKHA
jgi:hypothetical protein